MSTLVPIQKPALTPAQFGALPTFRPSSNGSPTSPTSKPAAPTKTMSQEFSAFAGLHEFRGAAHHHPRARHRLAQRPRSPPARRHQHPAQTLGAVLAVRLSLRAQRRRRQSGRRRQAADGQRQRRQHAGARRRARPASCSMRRPRTRSRASAIAPSWPPCSITASAARSSAGCA